jgi:hypothetical protein
MPAYLTSLGMWTVVWPLPLIAFVISGVVYFLNRSKESRESSFLVLLAFSMLGVVTGFLTGISRTAAVGLVLPAILSLVGGLGIFLIGTDPARRIIVSLSVFAFSVNLLVGSNCGAITRTIAEEQTFGSNYLRKKALIEVQVREFRKALGLPEWPYKADKGDKEDNQ